MSREQTVDDAIKCADELSELLDKTNTIVGGLCNATPERGGTNKHTLATAKRALRELDVMLDHAKKHYDQIGLLMRMSRLAADNLQADIDYVQKHLDKENKP